MEFKFNIIQSYDEYGCLDINEINSLMDNFINTSLKPNNSLVFQYVKNQKNDKITNLIGEVEDSTQKEIRGEEKEDEEEEIIEKNEEQELKRIEEEISLTNIENENFSFNTEEKIQEENKIPTKTQISLSKNLEQNESIIDEKTLPQIFESIIGNPFKDKGKIYSQKKQEETNQEKKNRVYNKKKNLIRYIIQTAIKFIANESFKDFIMTFPLMNKKRYEDFVTYFSKNIEKFNKISTVRKHWIEEKNASKEDNIRSIHFLKFCQYFISKKYPKYVLSGAKRIKRENCIHYLNYVKFLKQRMKNPKSFIQNS